jgi:hypothetical protein
VQRSAFRHRFDRIAHEIRHDLNDPVAIRRPVRPSKSVSVTSPRRPARPRLNSMTLRAISQADALGAHIRLSALPPITAETRRLV